MQVGLLRHGEVSGGNCFRGHTDDPLTPAGLRQMQDAVAAAPGWQRVISSPLIRCAEFAAAFAGRHTLPLSWDARWKEMHFGAWEGRTAAELMLEAPQALAQFWRAPDKYPPPGGEPLAQFQARVLAAWHELLAMREAECVLVVTHGGVIRVLLCHVLERPLARLLEFEVAHGGLYTLQIDAHGKARPDSPALARI